MRNDRQEEPPFSLRLARDALFNWLLKDEFGVARLQQKQLARTIQKRGCCDRLVETLEHYSHTVYLLLTIEQGFKNQCAVPAFC
jgi:hypothetical protein